MFHRGDLHRSVREELPPVPSIKFRLLSERMRSSYEEAIARDPDAQVGWYAGRPDGTKDWFKDHVDGDN